MKFAFRTIFRITHRNNCCGVEKSCYWSTKKLWSVTLFTISICCSRKKGFGHLFIFYIKSLPYAYVPSRLAHFSHSTPIVWNRKTQRSLVGGRGTSIVFIKRLNQIFNGNKSTAQMQQVWLLSFTCLLGPCCGRLKQVVMLFWESLSQMAKPLFKRAYAVTQWDYKHAHSPWFLLCVYEPFML